MMVPAFKQAANELELHVRFAKLNIEAEPEIVGRLSIRCIPTMILFSAGKEIQRQSGAMASQGIIDWVRPLIQQVA
jgi:thioredoxin 2